MFSSPSVTNIYDPNTWSAQMLSYAHTEVCVYLQGVDGEVNTHTMALYSAVYSIRRSGWVPWGDRKGRQLLVCVVGEGRTQPG